MSGRKIYYIFSGLSLAGIAWIFLNKYYISDLPVCLFRRFTGIPCPSCGTTGTILSIAGNNPHLPLFNILGIIILPLIIAVPVWIIFDLISGKESFIKFYRNSETIIRKKSVAIPLIVLLVINWIFLIIQFLKN